MDKTLWNLSKPILAWNSLQYLSGSHSAETKLKQIPYVTYQQHISDSLHFVSTGSVNSHATSPSLDDRRKPPQDLRESLDASLASLQEELEVQGPHPLSAGELLLLQEALANITTSPQQDDVLGTAMEVRKRAME